MAEGGGPGKKRIWVALHEDLGFQGSLAFSRIRW